MSKEEQREHAMRQLIKTKQWKEFEQLLLDDRDELREALEQAADARAIAILQGEIRRVNKVLAMREAFTGEESN